MKKKTVSTLTFITSIVLLPLMASAFNGNKHRVSLQEPIPLKLRYDVGETIYYKLLRHTTFFKMDGSRFGEHKALAYYERTRLDDDSKGRIMEKFTWRSFGFGQSIDPNTPAKMSYLKEADDFSLVLSVQYEDIISKFDFSGLPRTLEGVWFMIMSWDAVTFDGRIRAQDHFPFPDAALIGTEIRSTRGAYDFEFEYPPLLNDSRYSFSDKSGSKVLGVGMVGDTPCAIVEFFDSENRIAMNFDLEPVKIRNRGVEHFWGKTYLSLEDGRILKGELIAPVTQILDIEIPGQAETQHTELLALQRLELEMLPREEFDSEVMNIRAGAEIGQQFTGE